MRDYRRGIVKGVWQKLWHFHEDCPNYPTRNFEIRHVKPLDEDLCSRCDTLGKPNGR